MENALIRFLPDVPFFWNGICFFFVVFKVLAQECWNMELALCMHIDISFSNACEWRVYILTKHQYLIDSTSKGKESKKNQKINIYNFAYILVDDNPTLEI
jgi:hypothetical protein